MENIGKDVQLEEEDLLAMAISLSLQTDNDQALAQCEENLEGNKITGGAAATTEEDPQVIIYLCFIQFILVLFITEHRKSIRQST